MQKYSSFGLARPPFWLLLTLAGGLTASCSDAATSSAPQRDSQPSSSDGDDVEEDDVSDDEAAPDSDDAEKESSSLDAGLPTPRHSDAGRGSTPRADAGDAASVSKQADASTTNVASDAATTSSEGDAASADAGSADAALDGGRPASSQDAASAVADAQAPSTSSARTFKVDSKDEWTASGFQVEAGRCYDITVKIDDRWLDLDVPADLSGWIDKDDVRLILFEPLRRVTQGDIRFYQFATCVNKKLDQCFPVNASSSVCPKTAGELFFFVNDVSGFESNNVGTATVTIQAK